MMHGKETLNALTVYIVHWELNKSQGWGAPGQKKHDGWTTETELLDKVFLDFF
jgi:hypothetical protein